MYVLLQLNVSRCGTCLFLHLLQHLKLTQPLSSIIYSFCSKSSSSSLLPVSFLYFLSSLLSLLLVSYLYFLNKLKPGRVTDLQTPPAVDLSRVRQLSLQGGAARALVQQVTVTLVQLLTVVVHVPHRLLQAPLVVPQPLHLQPQQSYILQDVARKTRTHQSQFPTPTRTSQRMK